MDKLNILKQDISIFGNALLSEIIFSLETGKKLSRGSLL